MSFVILRNPPADNSGGVMAVRLQQSGRTVHISHLHVPGFSLDATCTYNGSPPIVGASTEASVAATYQALQALLHPLYDNTWDWQLTGLAQRQTVGGQPALVRVTPPLATGSTYYHHNGSGSTPTTPAQGQIQTILEGKTTNNFHWNLKLVGIGGQDYDVDGLVAADGAGTDIEKLVNYLLNVSAICGHSGGGLVGPVHRTFFPTSRARRLAMRGF